MVSPAVAGQPKESAPDDGDDVDDSNDDNYDLACFL